MSDGVKCLSEVKGNGDYRVITDNVILTPCLKKRPTFTTCYNFYIHSSIATIFDTNVAEKVGN